jgi:hypothetical protein
VPKSCGRLGAPTTFDRGAILTSLYHPQDALGDDADNSRANICFQSF